MPGPAHQFPTSSPSTMGSAKNSPTLRPSPSNSLAHPTPIPFHLLANEDDDEESQDSLQVTSPGLVVVANRASAFGSDASSSAAVAANDTLLPLSAFFLTFASTVSAFTGSNTSSLAGSSQAALATQSTLAPTIITTDTSSDCSTAYRSCHEGTSATSRPASPSLPRSVSRQKSSGAVQALGSPGASAAPALGRSPSMIAASTPLPNSSSGHLPLNETYSHHSHQSLPAGLTSSQSRNGSRVLPGAFANQSQGYLNSSRSSTQVDLTHEDTLMQRLADRDARIAQLEDQMRHLASADTAGQRLIADLEQQVLELTTSKRQVTQDLAVAKRELASNLTTLAKAQDTRDAHLARVRDLEAEVDRFKKVATGLSERLAFSESRVVQLEEDQVEAHQQVMYWQQQAQELHEICDRLSAELEQRETLLGEIDMGLGSALREELRSSMAAPGSQQLVQPKVTLADGHPIQMSVTSRDGSTATLLPVAPALFPTPLQTTRALASSTPTICPEPITGLPTTQVTGEPQPSTVCASTVTIQPFLSNNHGGSSMPIQTETRPDPVMITQLLAPADDDTTDTFFTPSDTPPSVHISRSNNPSSPVGLLEGGNNAGSMATLHQSSVQTVTMGGDSIGSDVTHVSKRFPGPPHRMTFGRQRSLHEELMGVLPSFPAEPFNNSKADQANMASPPPSPLRQRPHSNIQTQLHSVLTSLASRVYKHRRTLNVSELEFDMLLGFLDEAAGVTFANVLRAIASSGSNDEDETTRQSAKLQGQERSLDSAYVEPAPGQFELSKRSLADLLHQGDYVDHDHGPCCHPSHPRVDTQPANPSAVQPQVSPPPTQKSQQQSVWRSALAVYALNLLCLTGARVKQATIPNDIDNPQLGKHIVFSISPTPETSLFTGKWSVLNGWVGDGGSGLVG